MHYSLLSFSKLPRQSIEERSLEIAPAAAAIPLAMIFGVAAKWIGFSFGWGNVFSIILLLSLLAPWLWLQSPRSPFLYLLTCSILLLFSLPVVMELIKDQYFGHRHRHEYDIALNFSEYIALVGASSLVPIVFRLLVHRRMCRVNHENDAESWRAARGSTSDLMALTFGAALWLATLAKTDASRMNELLRMFAVLMTASTTVLLAAWITDRISVWRLLLGYVACTIATSIGWWISISIRRTSFQHPAWETMMKLQEQVLSPWPSYKWTDSITSGLVLASMAIIYVLILRGCGLKLIQEPPITSVSG